MKNTFVSAAVLALLAGCAGMSEGPRATASLQPTKSGKASGDVAFVQSGDKVRITGTVSGLTPNQNHGFHIHEVGDCSSGDGMSTKGHFNPHGKQHNHYSDANRHAGDLPPLVADANGRATIDATLDIITVTPGPASVVGRGLIVHVDPDDYRTQPTGNAGARVACAVIKAS
jgi:superoxide dismutase, Cu-Zn family